MQPFEPKVKDGDRRVFFLDGKLLASVVRVPKAGGYVSNLAQGGSAVSKPLSAKEKAVCLRLGKFLKAKKITLAGADLIGSKVSEVNITSPTGLRNILELENKNYADDVIRWIENKV
jgi:glutathione synthase